MGIGGNTALQQPGVVTQMFNNVEFLTTSGFARSLGTLPAGIAANVAALGVAVRSQDDSNQNRKKLSGAITALNARGLSLPFLNASGGLGHRQLLEPASPTLNVQNIETLAGATGIQGIAGTTFSRAQQANLMTLLKNINTTQATTQAALLSRPNIVELSTYANCAAQNSEQNLQATQPALDLRQDPTVAAIWGVNPGTNSGARDVREGSIAYNCLNGQAIFGEIERGGYDYHNNTRATGEQDDLDAGEIIRKCIETAAALGKKIFIVVTTDGSVTSATSLTSTSSAWVSDRGSAGLDMVFAYDPVGRPNVAYRGPGTPELDHLVGFYQGQSASSNVLVGAPWGVTEAMHSVIINYLGFCQGYTTALSTLNTLYAQIGKPLVTDDNLDRVLRFG